MAALVMAVMSWSAVGGGHAAGADGPFILSYFKDNGQDGLHLVWSADGLAWEALRADRPFLNRSWFTCSGSRSA